MPTTRQASTSTSTGTRIQRGRLLRDARRVARRRRSEEHAQREAQRIGDAAHAGQRWRRSAAPTCTAGIASTKTVSAKNISFDRKPFSSGTPAIAAVATSASVPVMGIRRNSPDSRRMSRVPVSWSMMPTAMNSDALNVAWFMRWNTAATAASGLLSPSSKHDEAEVRDGRVGEQPLEVVAEQRHPGPEQQRDQPRRPDQPEPQLRARTAPATAGPAGTPPASPWSPSAGRRTRGSGAAIAFGSQK